MCWSTTVQTVVLFIGRGVAYHKTGLHGILFISTVDLLQPPWATVHPRAPVHPASTAPPPASVQPALSTGSCSTTPPRATVHLALHPLLFNSPPWGPVHPPPTGPIGVLFIQRQRPLLPRGPIHPTPTVNYSSNPQQRSLFIKRQQVRSASVSRSSKGITRVQ